MNIIKQKKLSSTAILDLENYILTNSLNYIDLNKNFNSGKIDLLKNIGKNRIVFFKMLLQRINWLEAFYRICNCEQDEIENTLVKHLENMHGKANVNKYIKDTYGVFFKDNNIVEDHVYDTMLNLSKKWIEEDDFKQFRSNPAFNIGKESLTNEIKHKYPMYSLDNLFSAEEIILWILKKNKKVITDEIKSILDLKISAADKAKKIEVLSGYNDDWNEYVLEHKFDGAGIELYYEGGKLVQATTRGNGKSGEDILHNIKYFKGIPQIIDQKENIQVTGEILITKKDFVKLNSLLSERGDRTYKTARNTASAQVRRMEKDNDILKECHLSFNAYGCESDDLEESLYTERMKMISKSGIKYHQAQVVSGIVDSVEAYSDLIESRASLGYEVDGMVIKRDDLRKKHEEGYTSHHPRSDIAVKLPPEIVVSKLKRVEFNVGKTGKITPVAIIKPVILGGVTVSRATCHNMSKMKKLSLSLGTSIRIYRSGDVIPYICDSFDEGTIGNRIEVPSECPCCKGEVAYSNPEKETSDDEPELFCQNTDCKSRLTKKIMSMVGRDYLDIDGIGTSTAIAISEEDWFEKTTDIWDLTEEKLNSAASRENSGLSVDGKKIRNILNSIEAKRNNLPLDKALVSLQIPECGKKVSSILAEKYITLSEVIKACSAGLIIKIEGIGPITNKLLKKHFSETFTRDIVRDNIKNNIRILEAMSTKNQEKIKAYINDTMKTFSNDEIFNFMVFFGIKEKNIEKMVRLNESGFIKIISPEKKLFSSEITGKRIVLTGTFSSMSRKELGDKIKSMGGNVSGSISSKTDFVIAGENAGSKLTKANDLGVTVHGESFITKIFKA